MCSTLDIRKNIVKLKKKKLTKLKQENWIHGSTGRREGTAMIGRREVCYDNR